MIICINGKFVSDDKPLVSIYDRAFLYGDGIFDTLTIMNSKVLWFDDYYERLQRSAELTFIKLPFSKTELHDLLQQVIKKNQLTNCKVRINITRGECPQPMTGYKVEGYEPNYYLIPYELKLPSKTNITTGIYVVTVPIERFLPEAKTLTHLTSILAYILGKQKDSKMQDVIMVTRDNLVTESGNGNLFIVKNDVVITPKNHVLYGIGRKTAIKLAKACGFKVEQRDINLDELLQADEVFLSASGKGIIPIIRVDDTEFKVGTITKKLIEKFAEEMQ